MIDSPQHSSTPDPYSKILPLCLSRIAEGIICSVIFPYINEMIGGLGVPPESVGVWSAAAESAFMITGAVSGPLFAPLADKYGRRPVFLTCMFLYGVGGAGFGLVRSVLATVVCRGLLGLLGGAGVLSRTMLGELCDKSNRVRGFALLSPSIIVGLALGPVIGGFLSNPVPRLLPPSFSVFTAYPYLLPSLIAGSTGIAAWAASYLLLPETLPTSLRTSVSAADTKTKGGLRELLDHKPFQRLLMLYGCKSSVSPTLISKTELTMGAGTGCIQLAFGAMYPLFLYTPRDLGGMELSTDSIGIALTIFAGLSILITVVFFPILHKLIREHTFLLICVLCYPIVVVLFPLLWASQNSLSPSQSSLTWLSIGLMVAQMIFRCLGDISLTILDTGLIDAIPAPKHLAMANSLAFSVRGAARTIGPLVGSYAFSFSTQFPPDHPARQTVWIVLFVMCLPGVWLSWATPQRGGNGDRMGLLGGAHEEEMVELMRSYELARGDEGRL